MLQKPNHKILKNKLITFDEAVLKIKHIQHNEQKEDNLLNLRKKNIL